MKLLNITTRLALAGMATGAFLWTTASKQEAPAKVSLKSYKASECLSHWQKKKSTTSQSEFQALSKTGGKAAPATNAVQFECSLLYSEDWKYDDYGVYTFSAQSPVAFKERFLTENAQTGGGFFTDRYYYMTYYSEDYFTGEMAVYTSVYDKNSGEEVDGISQGMEALATDMDYDPIDDRAYGCFYGDGSTTVWGYMDPKTGEVVQLAPLSDELAAVAINDRGYAYGITSEGVLVSINKRTGQLSTIGNTNYPPAYLQTAAFGSDGKLYWAASSELYYSTLFQVDLTDGHLTTVETFYSDKEIVAMSAISPKPSTSAPAKAEDLKITTNGDLLTFGLSFTIPSRTYGASFLTGNVDYEVIIDGVTAKTGTDLPGSNVDLTLTAENAGNHYISVILSNASGNSEKSSLRQWIGIDEPMPVTDVKVIKESDTELTVAWDAPKNSVNGGFFDNSRLSYTVTRLPDYKIVSQNQKGLSFTDDLSALKGQSLVRYIITPYADTVEGASVTSEGIIMGKAFQVPIEFTFDTEEDYNIFTVIDNNETVYQDSGCWLYSPSGQVAGYNTGSKDGDDWLITPGIRLYADRKYIFSHDVLCYSDYWPDEYEVYLGNAATTAGMTTRLIEPTTIWWDEFRTKTLTITVPTDGVYYFGFHALSEAGGAFFLIDNISIKESLKLQAPGAVENLAISAGANGALEATITFDAPTHTVEGADVSSISTITVARDGKIVHTFNNPTPGETLTFHDILEAKGMTTYTVTPINSEGEGQSNAAEAWIGPDVPVAPVNPNITLDSNRHPVISWEAPSGPGMHGGYVDYANVTYSVYNGMTGLGLVQGIKTTCYTDESTDIDNSSVDQKLYTYIVMPFYETEFGGDASALYISGAPYQLPFKESFADATPSYYWAFLRSDGEGWKLADDMTAFSQDNDNGLMYYVPYRPEVVTTAMSGKISMKDVENPSLSFHLAKLELADNGFADYDPDTDYLNIKVSYDNFTPVTLASIHLNDIDTGGYQLYEFPIPDAVGCEFITISFEFEAYSGRIPVLIDNILVTDPTATGDPTSWPPASDLYYTLNEGTNTLILSWTAPTTTAGNWNKPIGYNIYRNSEPVNESLITATSYSISPILNGTYTVKAVYSNGESEASNPVTVKVNLSGLDMPAVTDLDYVTDGEDIILKWNAPVFEEDIVLATVTDGFENYRNGAITFGKWNTLDNSPYGNDGLRDFIVDFDLVDLPTANSGHAFMVWTPENYIDLTEHPEWTPHSGKNLILSFCDYASYLMEAPNDDWIISPKLDGESTTLTFWARTGSKANRNDNIRVMYSKDSDDISDFTVMPGGDINLDTQWTEYTFVFPKGTKYFAINNYSMKGYAVLIDDLEYQTGALYNYDNLVGYNAYYEGVQLNNELIPADSDYKEYTVAYGQEGEYYVTAVYDQGESEPSNIVTVSFAPLAIPAVSDLTGTVENDILTLTWSEPAGVGTSDVSFLIGYYIYRDGEILNPDMGIIWSDADLRYIVDPAVSGSYTVRAFYLDGESEDSNIVVIIATTGISDIRDTDKDDVFYDLMGIKVDRPVKGQLYIHNGKKIIF
ncbi:MAG: choice-of-anchor J domain-containing protein [Muribaculaceae bacterium]|nr:choice-of-anchor J domain-containing protein [Muribaculaceae bacterium]